MVSLKKVYDFHSRKHQNATTRRGYIVHATQDTYPVCGLYLRDIVYTDEDINCASCLSARDAENPTTEAKCLSTSESGSAFRAGTPGHETE